LNGRQHAGLSFPFPSISITEITNLSLVSLDISCNKIASLPVELRLMTSLVELDLSDNPLTSPPAQICVRGMIHVFKFLETIATKDGKDERSNSLRRTLPKQHSTPAFTDQTTKKRANVDSGYSTSDGGLDARWSHDPIPKWPSTPLHIRTELSKSDTSTPAAGISPGGGFYEHSTLLDDDQLKKQLEKRNLTHSNPTLTNGFSISTDISPEANTPDSQKSDERVKATFGNVQTYREYKEALRQQRSQESSSIYKAKDVSTPDGEMPPVFRSSSSPYNGSSQSSPISPYRNVGMAAMSISSSNGSAGGTQEDSKSRPVQKVTPSRNVNGSSYQNGSSNGGSDSYMKPSSPIKASGILQHNNVPNNNNINNNSIKGALVNGHKPLSATVGYVNNNKSGQKINK